MSYYKILYIYPEILPSSKARAISVINTTNELANICDCTLFVDSNSTNNILQHYDIANSNLNIQKIYKNILSIKSNKFFNYNLLKKIKKIKFDFIYVRHLKVAKFLIKKGFNVIFECHEIFYKSNIKTKNTENYVYKNAKGLVFINDTLKKEFNTYFDIKNMPQATIHNGCGFKLQFIKKDFSELKNIYYVGNFYPWKGIDFLIDAISYTNLNLKIIGNGDRKKELQDWIEKKNIKNIEFFGYKSHNEIKNILSTSKLTVIPNIPSDFSNFSSPIKLYEYLMTSNIVISSDTPVIKEVLEDRVNGFLFKSGDLDSFKNTLNYILSLDNNTLVKISKNAHKTALEFTWKNRAKKIIEFLKKIENEKANTTTS